MDNHDRLSYFPLMYYFDFLTWILLSFCELQTNVLLGCSGGSLGSHRQDVSPQTSGEDSRCVCHLPDRQGPSDPRRSQHSDVL